MFTRLELLFIIIHYVVAYLKLCIFSSPPPFRRSGVSFLWHVLLFIFYRHRQGICFTMFIWERRRFRFTIGVMHFVCLYLHNILLGISLYSILVQHRSMQRSCRRHISYCTLDGSRIGTPISCFPFPNMFKP